MKHSEIDLLLERAQRLIEQGLAELEKSQAIIEHSRIVAANAIAVRDQYLIIKDWHRTNAKRMPLSPL